MKIKARLLSRLRELLGDRDLGNGTPLADAAADAIAFVARVAGASEGELHDLTDVALLDAAEQVHCKLNRLELLERPLPFGSRLDSSFRLSIGGHTLLPDAGRPGLHAAETARDDAHGPNLERLVTLIRDKARGRPWEAIGVPAPSFSTLLDSRHHLDFPPFGPAGGVVLRQQVSYNDLTIFCSLMSSDLEAFADEMVSGMEDLWNERSHIGEHVQAVRSAFQKRLIEVHGPQSPVSLRLIALDWHEQGGEDSENPYLHVEFNSLDFALRPGVMGIPVHGDTNLEDPQLELGDDWDSLSERKTELLAKGAVGEIDELAAAIITAAPEGEQAVLGRLRRALETHVTLRGSKFDIHAKLFWSDGCIFAYVHRSPVIRSFFGELEVKGTLPTGIIAQSVGRPVSSLVELPFEFHGIIEAAEEVEDGWLRFKFAKKQMLIDAKTGTIRRRVSH